MEHSKCNRLYLTHIYKDFPADAFFPVFEDDFTEIRYSEMLIDWLYGVLCRFQQYFSYIAVASAPIHAFQEFF